MPVASSSRRRANTRIANSSDEEDASKLHTTKGNKSAKMRQAKAEVEREQSKDNSDEERIDVKNFTNQPLRREDLSKLGGLAKDWERMEDTIRRNWTGIGDIAVSMADASEADNRAKKGLDELDEVMRNLIDISAEMKQHSASLDEINQLVARGEEIDDAGDRYLSVMQSGVKDYAKKTTRQKYAKSEEYNTFKSSIYEVLHPGRAMPPLTDLIPREDGDDSDDEDELEIGGVTQNYTCPILLTPLVDPLTSAVCGHSFSGDAIRMSFRTPNASIKCPASGCNKSFRLEDCKPNKALQKKVKAWKRRTERAAENSDAEEIIE